VRDLTVISTNKGKPPNQMLHRLGGIENLDIIMKWSPSSDDFLAFACEE